MTDFLTIIKIIGILVSLATPIVGIIMMVNDWEWYVNPREAGERYAKEHNDRTRKRRK